MGKIKDALKEIFYPSGIKCIICDAELDRDTRYGICDKCELPYNTSYCSVCGSAIPEQNTICDNCQNTTMPFAAARSSFVYRDSAAKLVHKLKYRDAQYLAPIMAEFMADTFYDTDWAVDVITFVPLFKSRCKARGYNQSELLARNVAGIIKKDCVRLLDKTVKTKSMVGLNRVERRENVKDSFSVTGGVADYCGKTVMLIDDVLTTGATAGECARVLKENGIREVCVLTFAAGQARKPLLI